MLRSPCCCESSISVSNVNYVQPTGARGATPGAGGLLPGELDSFAFGSGLGLGFSGPSAALGGSLSPPGSSTAVMGPLHVPFDPYSPSDLDETFIVEKLTVAMFRVL